MHGLISGFWKPWFVYRPSQVLRRLSSELKSPRPGYTHLKTSWGAELLADATRTIGSSILRTGVHELAVSETLARLVSAGDSVIDAGANVGYMSLLASAAAGPTGRVLAFEPHPELFSVLRQNADGVAATGTHAPIDLHQLALGAEPGIAELRLPPDFGLNDGIATIESTEPRAGTSVVSVGVTTLDSHLGDRGASLLKLDVEGHEAQVLRGATRLLGRQLIRHIVFEDHAAASSTAVSLLCQAGYQLYSLDWTMRGLKVDPIGSGNQPRAHDSPNYLATIAPAEALAKLHAPGWLVLSTLSCGN